MDESERNRIKLLALTLKTISEELSGARIDIDDVIMLSKVTESLVETSANFIKINQTYLASF